MLHPTMLDDVGPTMLASFEHAFIFCRISLLTIVKCKVMLSFLNKPSMTKLNNRSERKFACNFADFAHRDVCGPNHLV